MGIRCGRCICSTLMVTDCFSTTSSWAVSWTLGQHMRGTRSWIMVWAEEQAAEDVAAAAALVGRRFPGLNLDFLSSCSLDWHVLMTNSFSSLWTTVSPAQRHGHALFFSSQLLISFYRGGIESALTGNMTVRFVRWVTAAVTSDKRSASVLRLWDSWTHPQRFTAWNRSLWFSSFCGCGSKWLKLTSVYKPGVVKCFQSDNIRKLHKLINILSFIKSKNSFQI